MWITALDSEYLVFVFHFLLVSATKTPLKPLQTTVNEKHVVTQRQKALKKMDKIAHIR